MLEILTERAFKKKKKKIIIPLFCFLIEREKLITSVVYYF